MRRDRTKSEDGFIKQMLDDCLPADIHYKRHLRAELGDVGEVLLGAYADVRAARRFELTESADNVEI